MSCIKSILPFVGFIMALCILPYSAYFLAQNVHAWLSIIYCLVVGTLGVKLSRLPVVEYMLLILIMTIIASLFINRFALAAIIAGIGPGWVWGSYLGDLLDRKDRSGK